MQSMMLSRFSSSSRRPLSLLMAVVIVAGVACAPVAQPAPTTAPVAQTAPTSASAAKSAPTTAAPAKPSASPAAPSPAAQPAASPAADTPATIKIGFLYDVHAANVWTMPECLRSRNVQAEMVNFKQFAEVQRAFQTGQVDFAGMGYQNLAQLEGANFSDYKLVAGVYSGSEQVTLRTGSEVKTWKDLAGKKVGIPPNSFVEMLFRYQAAANGLDINSVQIVNFPGAGPPMLAALGRGDIDAMVAWEPNNANAKVQGIGEYAPFDLQGGAVGKGTSVLYATDQVINSNPSAVQRVVDCLVVQTGKLNADPAAYEAALVRETGLSPEVARTAMPKGQMDVRIWEAGAQKIIQLFAQQGLVPEESAKVPQRTDYRFLQKATGKSESELRAQ